VGVAGGLIEVTGRQPVPGKPQPSARPAEPVPVERSGQGTPQVHSRVLRAPQRLAVVQVSSGVGCGLEQGQQPGHGRRQDEKPADATSDHRTLPSGRLLAARCRAPSWRTRRRVSIGETT